MRAEAPTPIYSTNSFLQLYSPVSGNYNLPGTYTGMAKNSKSSTLDDMRSAYSSAKTRFTELFSAKYSPSFAYK